MKSCHLVLFVLMLGYPLSAAWAWGEMGHFIVSLVASRLVQDPNLKEFLKHRGLVLGHVSNIPDIGWRDLPNADKEGENSHFTNAKNLPSVSLDWNEVVKAEKKPAVQVAIDSGSLWWRGDQFYRRAIAGGMAAREAPPGSQAYTNAVYEMMVSMGLAGHFVADASMPFHNSPDYNGWKAGHGGIHNYYEGELVDALGLGLGEKVQAKALEIRKREAGKPPPGDGSILARMKALSLFSSSQIDDILKKDKITAPSDEAAKKAATRPAADSAKALRAFGPMIVEQLSRSALLLAQVWDEAYRAAGSPDLKPYRSYRYPLAPEYVAIDYLDGVPPIPGALDCRVVKKLSPRKK